MIDIINDWLISIGYGVDKFGNTLIVDDVWIDVFDNCVVCNLANDGLFYFSSPTFFDDVRNWVVYCG